MAPWDVLELPAGRLAWLMASADIALTELAGREPKVEWADADDFDDDEPPAPDNDVLRVSG